MYCRHCGNQINDQAFICVHCGSRVGGESTATNAKPSNGNVLGIVGLCFSFVVPIVTFICSGIGLSHAISSKHAGPKALNLVALILGGVIFVASILSNIFGEPTMILY